MTQIAIWRHQKPHLSYDQITDRLNADPAAHPPPEPPGATRARGAWSKSSVCEILRNPKYSGYQVFNRRASRSGHGKHNPPEKWVWSPEPAHEPLIPKWMYDEITARRTAHRGSRAGHTSNTHPDTVRSYLLRGLLFCSCGRRMNGNHRHGSAYYRCYPAANNRGRPDRLAGHPKTVHVREDTLLDALQDFYSQRVFGPQRHTLLAADLAALDTTETRQRHQQRERHQRTLADITRRQHNLLRQAQDLEPGDPFAAGLRDSYHQLDANRAATLSALTDLDNHDANHPQPPGPDAVALLRHLPQLALTLTDAPQPLQRQLYQATHLTIHLHHETREIIMTINLPGDNIDTITHTAQAIAQPNPPPATPTHNNRVHAVGTAPGAQCLRSSEP